MCSAYRTRSRTAARPAPVPVPRGSEADAGPPSRAPARAVDDPCGARGGVPRGARRSPRRRERGVTPSALRARPFPSRRKCAPRPPVPFLDTAL